MSPLLRYRATLPVFALAVTSVALIGLASPAVSRAVPLDGCGYGMYFNTETNQCEPGGVDPHPFIGPVGPAGVGVGGPVGPGGVVGPVGVGPAGPGPIGPGPAGPGPGGPGGPGRH
ncbi:hypothetical protein [Mycolicibacter hiberniae]|uniref:Uncharacterized protein n=1 Tax=Mycolicibacter hiberniae TaxID=29314 RepID=A0A7I7X462_9MYCO|nr:hypothetical protein [Mycolicibacter hiberniae]MCV7084528.1 hypothetical protein [Mycolicibacter hiberniae]BBZ24404.1 hypothetical protein MHIB_28220 [Mycolicibacter hiberniae]